MVKITAVCGMGLGSGLLVKMGIERVLERNGYTYKDFKVEVADISTAKATFSDIFVTTKEFAERLEGGKATIVLIQNLFNEKEIEGKLLEPFIRIYNLKKA